MDIKIAVYFLCITMISVSSCSNNIKKNNLIKTVEFCSLIENSNEYESATIETKATMIGFHQFVLYDENCLDKRHVIKLEFDNNSRQQLVQMLNPLDENYSYKGNIYGEVTIVGSFVKNSDDSDILISKLSFKVNVIEVKELLPLDKKILPENN